MLAGLVVLVFIAGSAIFAAYEAIEHWQPHRSGDLLQAHGLLMAGLVDRPGRLRNGDVGIWLLSFFGLVPAVAAELGLSPDVCYRWRHETGTSSARGRSRVYSANDKAEFFRRLALKVDLDLLARLARADCLGRAGDFDLDFDLNWDDLPA